MAPVIHLFGVSLQTYPLAILAAIAVPNFQTLEKRK